MLHARDAALCTNGLVSERLMVGDRRDGVVQRLPVRVRVNEHPVARGATEQLIHRHVHGLAGNVPQRGVDGGNRRHGHRASPPVRALVEVLPGVFDPAGVAANQQRHEVIGKVAGDGQLASVQRRIAQAVNAVFGHQLQRHEVAAGATDDHLGVDDAHDSPRAASGFEVRDMAARQTSLPPEGMPTQSGASATALKPEARVHPSRSNTDGSKAGATPNGAALTVPRSTRPATMCSAANPCS